MISLFLGFCIGITIIQVLGWAAYLTMHVIVSVLGAIESELENL